MKESKVTVGIPTHRGEGQVVIFSEAVKAKYIDFRLDILVDYQHVIPYHKGK
jgi:hypothetical protein